MHRVNNGQDNTEQMPTTCTLQSWTKHLNLLCPQSESDDDLDGTFNNSNTLDVPLKDGLSGNVLGMDDLESDDGFIICEKLLGEDLSLSM